MPPCTAPDPVQGTVQRTVQDTVQGTVQEPVQTTVSAWNYAGHCAGDCAVSGNVYHCKECVYRGVYMDYTVEQVERYRP